jgi:putative pyruvate formate lyase activating enzyme
VNTHFEPAYLELALAGELEARARIASQRLTECTLCPRNCRVDRMAGEFGVCQTGAQAIVASFQAHFGEERPLVGRGGSGTIFFSHCNLKCVFCQNYDISHAGHGQRVEPRQLAAMMLHLQDAGCHNINLVSPSHVVPPILSALAIAAAGGLRVPLVYNTGGYDAIETLQLLDGVIDIYMPDMKYADPDAGRRYSGVDDYPTRNQDAVREMHRQVGDLRVDERGVAERGLLVRHLVLPDGLAGTDQVVRFLAEQISTNTYLNVMDQYYPCHRAGEFRELTRRITAGEYRDAIQMAEEAGLTRLDHRVSRAWRTF